MRTANEDLITVKGHALVELRNADGELVEVREVDNIITTIGRAMIVDQLLASTAGGGTKPTHMGVGTGSGVEAVGNTSLTGESRVALTTKSRAANVLTMVGDWAAGVATGTLQEAGTWDAAAAGNLLSRVVFTAIPKGANDTLKITWTWTIG